MQNLDFLNTTETKGVKDIMNILSDSFSTLADWYSSGQLTLSFYESFRISLDEMKVLYERDEINDAIAIILAEHIKENNYLEEGCIAYKRIVEILEIHNIHTPH